MAVPARRSRIPFALMLLSLCPLFLQGQTPSANYFNGLAWRLIGPFRAGRVAAVAGVPGGGSQFYFGAVDGGVWKTADAGTVWKPVFDHEPIASIGALAVAPSDPSVIYAGTGESDIRSDLSSGDGVYKSTDAGRTWKNIGLRDSRQISRILIDPSNPEIVYVGALGHAYGPNDQRGVYKSTDGGTTWKRILDKGPDTGIADMAMATGAPHILFAAAWNARRPPWSTYAPAEGPGNGLYRSTDGGATWTQLQGHGLPQSAWGRAGVAVSPDGRRVYATIDAGKESGLYRSDDGGDSWTLANRDPRLTSRGWYFNCIAIDPSHPDVLYIPNVALYRTEDGGRTIQIVRGAPGGDDYHQIWVDPKDSAHLVLGVDQGATVSLDRGRTWSSWYNQPTAQLYHVTTDDRFPYAVYGAQQDSGSVAVLSRSDHGHIDARDWFEPGGSESGYIAIDPRDADIAYVTGTYGDVQRFDRRTAFSQNITPWPLGGFDLPINKRKYRDPWTPPLVFSPADRTSLYLGTQYLLKTTDGGLHWEKISPDLTGAKSEGSSHGPVTVADAEQRGFGVVFTIAPSPLRAQEIWVGSDTGLVHLTRDGGKTWSDVTPKGLSAWSKISLIEASHFDPATAYAAVDRHRLDDQKPYLYITHDYGQSWHAATEGIGPSAFLRAVREDPRRRGLLFAGTELGVYVSFDDGDRWQPLQLNLPVCSVRDLDVHGDDLVIATHGRSFWILDDIAPLRQMAAAEKTPEAYFYAPATAIRVDNDAFLGTPLPPEEPQANNPPKGAIFDYLLKSPAQTLTLEIFDSNHRLLRHFSSAEKPPRPHPPLPIAERWFPAPQTLETTAGEHRFVWDLAYGGSGAQTGDDDADEAFGAPSGPKIVPGDYRVRLTVDGRSMEQPLHVVMDPRVSATVPTLAAQFDLARSIYRDLLAGRKAMAELQSVQSELNGAAASNTNPQLQGAIHRAQAELAQISGAEGEGEPGLREATSALGTVLRMAESGHRAAPAQAVEIYNSMSQVAQTQTAAWDRFKASTLPGLNDALRRAGGKPVQIGMIEQEVHYLMTR